MTEAQSPLPNGRKLLRLEARNSETPIERKPEWIKTRAKMGPHYRELQQLVKGEGLHTVCQEAGCPNIFECWEDREATFLIGGDQCTRRCDFCQIDTGKPQPLDRDEPMRVAESVRTMGLRYATITGVARDDLPDEGAWLYAETVRKAVTPEGFKSSYEGVFAGDARWQSVQAPVGELYTWDDSSTYVQNPPYFTGMGMGLRAISDVKGARALARDRSPARGAVLRGLAVRRSAP